MENLDKLLKYLNQFSSFTESDLKLLGQHLKKEFFTAKSFVFREGEKYDRSVFIIKGLLKKFYLAKDGKEFIKEFNWEGQSTTPYASVLQNIPATYSMQALEDTELLTFPYFEIERLAQKDPRWLLVSKKLADLNFLSREKREMELLNLSAQERYDLFKKDFPHLLERLKKQDIASYLGITPVSLSRLN